MSEDSDITGPDEDAMLVAEFVLGTLSATEHAALAARLRAEPQLRAQLRFWRERLAGLDVQFAETTAPPRAWSAIERRLFAPAGRPGLWESLALWRGLAATALAVAIVAIGVNVLAPRPDPNAFAAQVVAALSMQGSSVSVVALYNTSTGQIRLTALSGETLPDKDYELWAIEGSNAPKSMGLISVTSRNDMTLTPQDMVGFGAGTMLAITLEPKGGSPTSQPTGPMVAKGMITAI